MDNWTGRRAQAALRRAAHEYTARGWSVVPGHYLTARQPRRCPRHGEPRDCRRRGGSLGRRACRRAVVRAERCASAGAVRSSGGGRRSAAMVCSCAEPTCRAPGAHPVESGWQDRVARDAAAGGGADVVDLWWSRRPYTVLLATGFTFEAFEAPADLGAIALRRLGEAGVPVGPVCRAVDGRWIFFAAPCGQSFPDLTDHLADHPTDHLADHPAGHLVDRRGVRHKSVGQYVAAPPSSVGGAGPTALVGTAAGGGTVEWVRPPSERNRRLAEAPRVAAVLEDACAELRATTAPARPRPRYRLGIAGLR